MRPSKRGQRKPTAGTNTQKRFLSIVFVCFSIGFFYLGIQRIAGVKQQPLLRIAQETTQNLIANESSIALSGKQHKPLPFCKVKDSELALCFPADVDQIAGVGFHESDRPEAIALEPMGDYHMRESTEIVSRSISTSRFPVLFVMYSRGRRQAPTSAVDVAVRPDAVIKSPVDGMVKKVETYYLYGKYMDYRVEIQPKDHPELAVVMIHLDKLALKQGQQVYKGNTEVGIARRLSLNFDSQINEYVSEECDHVHIQTNRHISEQPAKQRR